MKYRPEIDGLRAVAVVPVVLFHAGVSGFGGGFVGVDIFFVISGYLITSIIHEEIQNNNFSLARFYERRARRILPALTVVMAACIPFSYTWMTPQELVDFGQSLVATSIFFSNVLFWLEAGYFSAPAEMKPLLHTWSLSVEEQFYIFFPLLLLALKGGAQRALSISILVVMAASIAAAEWGSVNALSANFYLLPTRIWELMAGGLVAITTARRPIAANGPLAILGLLLILVSVFFFDPATPSPSFWTLLPVVGTILVIAFGAKGTLLAMALSFPPMVAIGLISYSMYLWHQPILAFYRIRALQNPQGYEVLLLFVAIFVLASLTWKFVEQPFRKGGALSFSRYQVFLASATSMCLAVVVGLFFVFGDGLPTRTAPNGEAFASFDPKSDMLAPNYGLSETCDRMWPVDLVECSTPQAPTVALWGDSFAMHLAPVLLSSETRLGFTQLTLSQCGPLYGLAIQGTLRPWRDCIDHNNRVLGWILANPDIDLVMISSTFDQMSGKIFTDEGLEIADHDRKLQAVVVSFTKLKSALLSSGKKIVVVSPPPRTGVDLGICILRSRLMGVDESVCDFPQSAHAHHSRSSIELISAIGNVVPVIRLDQLMCSEAVCPATISDTPLYRDHGHLSIAGAKHLGDKVDLMGLALNAVLASSTASSNP